MDILNECEDNEKIEILVQGSVELMKTRYGFKKDEKYLLDNKNNRYPIYKNLSEEELIIFNCEELSLINEVKKLKENGCINFSIDGRYKNKEYINMINIYNDALNGYNRNKDLLKLSSNNTKANY